MDNLRYVQFEPSAGSAISEVALIAIQLAKEKDCFVGFRFNGIKIIASKNDDRYDIETFYHKCMFNAEHFVNF